MAEAEPTGSGPARASAKSESAQLKDCALRANASGARDIAPGNRGSDQLSPLISYRSEAAVAAKVSGCKRPPAEMSCFASLR